MILYNKDKKAYVNYVEQKLRSDIVTDISLASELTEAQAKALLRKCTSKLKGFKIVNRSQFQPQAATAAAVVLNAAKSALEAKPEPPSEPEPQKPDRQKEQSTLIAKNSSTQFYRTRASRYLHQGQRDMRHLRQVCTSRLFYDRPYHPNLERRHI